MKQVVHTSKWVVFNPKTFKRVKTVTIEHESNLLYLKHEPFEKDLIKKGLAAHDWHSLNQSYLKGKTLEQKLKILGW